MSSLQHHIYTATGDEGVTNVLSVFASESNRAYDIHEIESRSGLSVEVCKRHLQALSVNAPPFPFGFKWVVPHGRWWVLSHQAISYLAREEPHDYVPCLGWLRASPANRNVLMIVNERDRNDVVREMCLNADKRSIMVLVGQCYAELDAEFDDDDSIIWSRYSSMPKLNKIINTLPATSRLRFVSSHESYVMKHIRAARAEPSDHVIVSVDCERDNITTSGGSFDEVVLMRPGVNVMAAARRLKVPPGMQRLPGECAVNRANASNPLAINGRTWR